MEEMAKRTERNDGVVHCRLVLPLLFYRLNRIQTFTSHVEARFPTRQTRVPLILSDVTTPNSPNAVYHPRFVHTCFARTHRVHLFSTARFARLCRIHSTAASERRGRERERERERECICILDQWISICLSKDIQIWQLVSFSYGTALRCCIFHLDLFLSLPCKSKLFPFCLFLFFFLNAC